MFLLLLVLLQPPTTTIDKIRSQTFDKVNVLRTDKSLPALKRDATLDALAQDHAENMAKQDKYGDDGKNGHILDGKGFADRAKITDYPFKIGGENVHMNGGFQASQVATIATKGWKESPPHYKTILNASFVETGIGVAQGKSGKFYFVQVFGSRK